MHVNCLCGSVLSACISALCCEIYIVVKYSRISRRLIPEIRIWLNIYEYWLQMILIRVKLLL